MWKLSIFDSKMNKASSSINVIVDSLGSYCGVMGSKNYSFNRKTIKGRRKPDYL